MKKCFCTIITLIISCGILYSVYEIGYAELIVHSVDFVGNLLAVLILFTLYTLFGVCLFSSFLYLKEGVVGAIKTSIALFALGVVVDIIYDVWNCVIPAHILDPWNESKSLLFWLGIIVALYCVISYIIDSKHVKPKHEETNAPSFTSTRYNSHGKESKVLSDSDKRRKRRRDTLTQSAGYLTLFG